MIAKSLLLALVAGALALPAAGCGGDGDGGGEPLAKADFISQADAICKKHEAEGDAIKPEDLPSDFDPTSAKATDEQLDRFGDYIDKIVPLFRDQLDELRDLNPPEDFQTNYSRALELLDETANEYEEAGDAAHDADRETLKEKLEEGSRHSDEADKIATDYGLEECGSA